MKCILGYMGLRGASVQVKVEILRVNSVIYRVYRAFGVKCG